MRQWLFVPRYIRITSKKRSKIDYACKYIRRQCDNYPRFHYLRQSLWHEGSTANMVKDAKSSPDSISSGSTDPLKLHSKKDAEPYWPVIGTKDDIPTWLQENGFIVGGRPLPTHSYKRSFRLWRCFHVEMMNIWTHLLGSAVSG